ncbi:hypothetical protein [Halomonas sp.]|uniref:hypothetical protein n=1 Tax=Halomonas sp. TaxID=1486246 RepID=UPI00356959F1
MSTITRHLADGLPVRPGIRIEHLEKDGEDWWLIDQDHGRHGPFGRVVISVPSPQARELLSLHEPGLAEECDAVIQQPCWAAWARFDAPLPSLAGVDDDWQAVRLAGEPLRFVSRNDHKPGRREQGESLSLLAHIELGAGNIWKTMPTALPADYWTPSPRPCPVALPFPSRPRWAPIAGAMPSPMSSPRGQPSTATIDWPPTAWPSAVMAGVARGSRMPGSRVIISARPWWRTPPHRPIDRHGVQASHILYIMIQLYKIMRSANDLENSMTIKRLCRP